MKKIILPFIIVLVLSLCGCSRLPVDLDGNTDFNDTTDSPVNLDDTTDPPINLDNDTDLPINLDDDTDLPINLDDNTDFETLNDNNANIEILKGWSFQSNTGTNDYSLFFGLLNNNDTYISANVDVDIRIVNDAGEEVYNATKSVSEKDFDYYKSQAFGSEYLANIRIPSYEIKSGKSRNGTVYLTVYNDIVSFDEVNCTALYCLPVADVQLFVTDLPIEINIKGYNGSVESILNVTNVSYIYEKEYTPKLNIIFSGQKIYGNNSGYDIISYKLYDSEDYLVYSGNVYLSSLSEGDKFKDDSIVIYDITPGENYTVQFYEYNW